MKDNEIIAVGVKKHSLLKKKEFLKEIDRIDMRKRQLLNAELNNLLKSSTSDSEE